MVVGHSHLIQDFQKLAQQRRLAQGYIFFGEPEVGKFYLTQHLVSFLECGIFELPSRPLQDALLLLDATGIDAMRQIKNFLWQKPAISSKRVVAVDDADRLTPEAQNAILKINEEPPPHTMIILVVRHLENLIAPLLSRMQKIYFGRLRDTEMRMFVEHNEREAVQKYPQLVELSWGRPGRAFRIATDPLMQEGKRYAEMFVQSQKTARSLCIKNFVAAQKDRPELFNIFFSALISMLRENAAGNAGTLASALKRLQYMKSLNTNKRIQLEAL